MDEKEIYIDTREIGDFFFDNLIRRGFVPSEDDLINISDIMFDYMVHKGIIDEEVIE